jgi:predicted anti-sigma-YlaC factor YlaD
MSRIPTCRDMSEAVTDYLEHSLPWRARLAAGWHLTLCPACRRYYQQMRQTIGLLRSGRLPPPDAVTTDALLARLREDDPPPSAGDGPA